MTATISRYVVTGLALLVGAGAGHARSLPQTSDQFDNIRIGGSQHYSRPPRPASGKRSAAIAEAQIIMDRGGVSPGVIDGLDTPRFRLALDTWNSHHPDNPIKLADLPAVSSFTSYVITTRDTGAFYIPVLPVLYVDQTGLKSLAYRHTREMLAERFHIDETYLAALNPHADFGVAGTTIRVPDTGRDLQRRVARIEADKKLLQLRAYAENGDLVAAYPASIGSQSTPSPAGTHTVRNKAQNPGYTYDPDGSAQPGLSRGLVRLPAGPNGPVGNAWIGLSKKTYGIHGTPEPSQIGITASVGCVRLTNWDALELARLVRRGTEVSFIDADNPS